MVAKTKEVSGGRTTFVQRLHALDLATGAEKFDGPEVITREHPRQGRPFRHLQRPDREPAGQPGAGQRRRLHRLRLARRQRRRIHGWVLGYKASDVRQQVAVFNATPNGSDGGIWMSGGGISADAPGNLFVGIGNGTFDANKGGPTTATPRSSSPPASGLAVADSFTPTIQAS